MPIPQPRQPGTKEYRLLEAQSLSNLQDQMNNVAREYFYCVSLAAVDEKQVNVTPPSRLKYIAVMERAVK